MKVAVIGGGISGLGAAWILSQKHEVHIFESESRLGGHANTVYVKEHNLPYPVPIDTGFFAYNETMYPHLRAFLKELQVETAPSEMSLSVSAPHKKLEWAGTSLDSIFAQRRNILKPKFIGMLMDIMRFQREAEMTLKLAQKHSWSLAQMIHERRYGKGFLKDYLLPMGAALWSTPEQHMQNFPAETLIAFFINHQLLQVSHRPIWRTIKDGSIEYVKKVAKKIPSIHLGTPVYKVERVCHGVTVQVAGETLLFDKVVLATHAPVTLKILHAPHEVERDVLTAIRTRPNRTVLHQDETLMPKIDKCWSSWNVFSSEDVAEAADVFLTYYLNKVQSLPTEQNYFVSLNSSRPIKKILREFSYAHPQFDGAALLAQKKIPSIQGDGGIYYAGAWTRHGFHEDGLLSAVNIGELMDLRAPWAH